MQKLFTMFKTSPRQYYANVSESLLDAIAGKKDARKEFARRWLVGQIILPLTFQAVSDLLRMGFNDEDEDDFETADYVRAMVLGPLNGLFMAGDIAAPVASAITGTKIWDHELPIYAGGRDIAHAINDLKGGDLLEGADGLLRGMGKMVPTFTYYEILRRETDRLGLTD